MKKVITYGTYDLLHYGHIRLLERAKALGDYLIVGVTADDFDKTRGKINVQQSLMERIEGVKATGIADEIIVEEYEGQKIEEKKYTKWFDYDKIKGNLTVRKRQPGDYLTVTPAGGRKKLKDYLIDCKIPRQERENLTLLADGSHIVWVVGYRISEYYKITEQTKTVIEVQVKGEMEDE